jgi:hypothetical protein
MGFAGLGERSVYLQQADYIAVAREREMGTNGIAVKLSKLWKSTSRPALMCTAVGQDSVLNVSTIPRVGFNARLAMPVLKDLEVISRIAVPVVSEPVPAVVGTS